jgi:energy-coupling factor transporter ATP-binding protein EcfA2
MVTTKKNRMGSETRSIWGQDSVEPSNLEDFSKEIANTEKIIVYGESNSGKTSFYLSIAQYAKSTGIKPEEFMMCIVFPDRPTGITKLLNSIPLEYRDRIFVYSIDKYEEMLSATSMAKDKLMSHFKSTGKPGWLVCELLEESWRMSQDYYTRKAYGENLGNYFATKAEVIKEMMKDKGKTGKESAFQAFQGFMDWVTIKYFHNYNWIDKIKRFPFNVVFTAEVKDEVNKDSIFYDLGKRPAGEKDNMHRVDTILHLSHKRNEFTMQPFKLTGFTKLYRETKITGKNAYAVHRKALKQMEEKGLRSSVFEETEQAANIKPPKKPKKKQKPKEPSKEQDDDIDFDDI